MRASPRAAFRILIELLLVPSSSGFCGAAVHSTRILGIYNMEQCIYRCINFCRHPPSRLRVDFRLGILFLSGFFFFFIYVFLSIFFFVLPRRTLLLAAKLWVYTYIIYAIYKHRTATGSAARGEK